MHLWLVQSSPLRSQLCYFLIECLGLRAVAVTMDCIVILLYFYQYREKRSDSTGNYIRGLLP
jgi:hypothetical protein